MKIKFQTKEESNKEQREEFLKLSPSLRCYQFIQLMSAWSRYPTKNREKKDNFIILIDG